MPNHSPGDGRNIDPNAAELAGEAAEQRVSRSSRHRDASARVWEQVPGDSYDRGYYDRPVLKEPVWIWAVPAYFFLGGAAGAASVLGWVSEIIQRETNEDLIRRCKVVGVMGTSLGSALLIHDLGRPERFMNMLRVFRPTSTLNMGSWILATAGAASSASLMFPRSRLLSTIAGLAGLPEAGYTAVLLSDTAVPIWQETRKTLPLLFVAASASSAASVLEVGDLDEDSRRTARSFGLVSRALGLAAAKAVEKNASEVERVGRPLVNGLAGSLWRAFKIATLSALGLELVPGDGRFKRFIIGALGLTGVLAMRFAIFHAGIASARDPQATFEQQRSRLTPN